MSTKLSPSDQQFVLQSVLQQISNRKIAKELGVDEATVRRFRKSLSEDDVETESPMADNTPRALVEKSEIAGDRWELTLPQTPIHTLEQLIESAQVDTAIWDVERFHVNKYELKAKDDPATTPLFRVKAFLRRRKQLVNVRAEIESLKAEAKSVMRVPAPVVYSTQDSDNMLELLIPDLHVAKLAWSGETGFSNYDTEIAVDTYRRAVDTLVQSSSNLNLDKIVLGVGNDLLQADNIQGTTFGGTKVDVDSRYRKTYITVRKMMTEAIEKLRKIAPVEVKAVPGNHDTLSAFTLSDSLECRFHNYSDVVVDNAPTLYKTFEWGKVFLVFLHGDKGKQTKYGMWMASTFPEQFGRTKFRELHVGHRHTTGLVEEFGVRVRTFSSLSGTDEWHANNMFTGNLRVAEGLVWNRHRGLIANYYHTEID